MSYEHVYSVTLAKTLSNWF